MLLRPFVRNGRPGLIGTMARTTIVVGTGKRLPVACRVVSMLPVALAMVGTGLRRVTVGFLGWFGPRGLASIVFVLILLQETDLPERSLMLTVVTWTVALSVYAHGLTAGPGATRYANWYHAHHEHHRVMPESASVAEQRTRGLDFSQRSSG